jgi:non-heme chloroperoxidase
MHGDDDQIVPFPAAGALSSKLVKHAQLKVYPGFPHGMPIIHADKLNPDLLEFIQSQPATRSEEERQVLSRA